MQAQIVVVRISLLSMFVRRSGPFAGRPARIGLLEMKAVKSEKQGQVACGSVWSARLDYVFGSR